MNLLFAHPALSFSLARSVARSLFVLPLMCCWLPVVQAQTNTAQAAPEASPLELGKPIERELAGGQSHTYQITLTAGQYLNVIVEQRGIDVVVVLTGPDGKQIFEFDNERRKQGPETVWQAVEVSGSFRLMVRATQKGAPVGRYEIRLVELRAATEQDRTLQEASKLYVEGDKLLRASKSYDARPLFERSLEMRERVLGSEHPDVAQALNGLATTYYNLADNVKAEPLYQRALAIREKTLGPEHPDLAISLTNLARLYRLKHDYAKAKPLYNLALAISEKGLEQGLLDSPHFLDDLAILYAENADYGKAELLLERKLAIIEKVLGRENPYISEALTDLARIYFAEGDYVRAEPLFQRALTIIEKVRGSEHLDVAGPLANLGIFYRAKGDYGKAEPLQERALAISEKALGPVDTGITIFLLNLGGTYTAKGEYSRAEPLLQRALAINENMWGPESEKVAISLSFLASLYRDKGDYEKAEPLLKRALLINEKYWGAEHSQIFSMLSRLAKLYQAKGEVPQAINFISRESALSEHIIALNLATGSERQKLAFLAIFSEELDTTISLHVGAAPSNASARNLALTIILQRKGRGLDAMTDSIAALRRRANDADRTLLDQLQETNAQLAELVLKGPQRTPIAEHQARIKSLEEQKEKLESDISRRSAEFRVKAMPVTVETVQTAIPAQTALVEFASYRPFNPKYQKADEQFGAPRYVAYVLPHQGEAQWVELGEAKAIDEVVEKLRQALRDKQRKDVKQLARAVDEKVMRPVRALLGQTQRVFISPDGSLNLIPFAALVDERNRYLVQRYTFSYLTSGRDLLRLQVKQPSKQSAMVVANPDFGEAAKAGAAKQRLLVYKSGSKAATGEGSVLSNYYFPPLPGTATEARAIKTIMNDSTVLTQAQATETALKQVSSPRILHIATHGFFLENQKTNAEDERRLKHLGLDQEMPLNLNIENPLLRSGLGLAGANLQKSGDDDGILTAQEAAGLDLWGTKLVVLSACDTGVGEVKNGEGVYGLRRALVLAGSETQVMSLWPVSDLGTRDLMIGYYKRLLAGQGRTEALRNTQLEMLRSGLQGGNDVSRLLVPKGQTNSTNTGKKDRSHPYYWASFIQSGEWANLDGKR